jgi:hypothetical protein
MLILELTATLQPFVKNPHSLAVERSAVQTLRDVCDQLLSGMGPAQ